MGCTASSVSTPVQEPTAAAKDKEVSTEAMERDKERTRSHSDSLSDPLSAENNNNTAAGKAEEKEGEEGEGEGVEVVSVSLSVSPSTPRKFPAEGESVTDAERERDALPSTPASTSAEPSATAVKRERDGEEDAEAETETEALAMQQEQEQGEADAAVDSESEGQENAAANATATTVDFAAMLCDERVQALLRDGKTTEEKLRSLFAIYDEDGDARLSEKEVNDVVWMSEAAHTHTHSPVKESESETVSAAAALSLSLSAQSHVEEQTYLDSPAGSAPSTPFAEHVPVSSGPAEDSAAVSLSAAMEEAHSASTNASALSPHLTRAAGPANRKSKKLVHSPIAGSSPASPTPAGVLDDFSEPVAVAVSSPAPSASQSANTTPVNGTAAAQRKAAISAKKAERRASEVEDLNVPHELVPPQKKGFLRVNVLPASSKANKFHVLDAGVLYHLDSATSSAFSMDRKGISLKDRVLSVSDAQPSVMLLVRPAGYVSKEDGDDAVVEIGIRGNNSEERDEWIDAFQKHIAFAEVLATYRKPAV